LVAVIKEWMSQNARNNCETKLGLMSMSVCLYACTWLFVGHLIQTLQQPMVWT